MFFVQAVEHSLRFLEGLRFGHELPLGELAARDLDAARQLLACADALDFVPSGLEVGDAEHHVRGAPVLRDDDRAVGPGRPRAALGERAAVFGEGNDVLVEAGALDRFRACTGRHVGISFWDRCKCTDSCAVRQAA